MVHKHEKGSGSVAKRLLGLCLALVMLLALLPVAAYAEETKQEEQVPQNFVQEWNVTIPVYVHLSGRSAAANETFTVTLEAVDEGTPMPDTATIQVPAVATDNKTASGEFKIHYTVPGVYHYKITQTAGNAAYTSYDKTVYYVTVSVFYNENGDLDCEVAARKNDPNTTAKAGAIEFFNSYSRPGHRVPTTNPTTPGTLIQTGQLNWPVPVLAGLGAALIALGCVLLRKRRNGRHA